jgi:hypothetical protein
LGMITCDLASEVAQRPLLLLHFICYTGQAQICCRGRVAAVFKGLNTMKYGLLGSILDYTSKGAI